MSPPPAAPLRVAERSARSAPGQPWVLRRPYAAAVIVPPIATYLATLALIVLAADTRTIGVPVLRPALIAGIHLPLLYVLTTTTRGFVERGCALWTFLPDAVLLLALLEALVPGPGSGLLIQALIVVASLVAQPTAGAWRRAWEELDEVSAALVVPDRKTARAAIARLGEMPHVRLTSILIPSEYPENAQPIEGLHVFTDVSSLLAIEKRAIVANAANDKRVSAAVAQLVARGYDIASESSLCRAAEGRIDSEVANPLSLLLGRSRGMISDAVSRCLDFLVAATALLFLAPVFLVVAILIKLDSKGPVFFRQVRLGKGGRPFHVVKFRSMRADAEKATGPVWATENDPRITRVGRVLRKLRIDELPQLINVLTGQMALVGPRPERSHFFRKLRVDVPMFELRTAVKPGITGWAQIRAPYAASADDSRVKLNYDLYYVWRRSPWFDLAILIDTVTVAFGGRGAR